MGAFGMRVQIVSNTAMHVTDYSPVAESHYRARFYFDPNSVTMTPGDSHDILLGYSDNQVTAVLRVEFYFSISKNQYMLRVQARDDAASWHISTAAPLSDAPHMVELEWQAASAPSNNDGILNYWLDGRPIASVTGLDTDTRRIESVRLGAVSGIDSGTRGVYFLDAFESRRNSYIGAATP